MMKRGLYVNEQRANHGFFTGTLELGNPIIGVVLLIGAIMNWNWLCDPTGKPDSHRYGRGSRRVIFFLLGVLLIVVSIWDFALGCK